jgi:hypothetical protein
MLREENTMTPSINDASLIDFYGAEAKFLHIAAKAGARCAALSFLHIGENNAYLPLRMSGLALEVAAR